MPVDPYGTGIYDTIQYDENISPPNQGDLSLWDIISQGIHEGAQTAQIVGAGYPPGSTIVYSPQYPAGQIVQAPPPGAYPMPLPGPGVPTPTPAPGGVNLSNTTLMLLVGGVLLFVLGSKKGR